MLEGVLLIGLIRAFFDKIKNCVHDVVHDAMLAWLIVLFLTVVSC